MHRCLCSCCLLRRCRCRHTPNTCALAGRVLLRRKAPGAEERPRIQATVRCCGKRADSISSSYGTACGSYRASAQNIFGWLLGQSHWYGLIVRLDDYADGTALVEVFQGYGEAEE